MNREDSIFKMFSINFGQDVDNLILDFKIQMELADHKKKFCKTLDIIKSMEYSYPSQQRMIRFYNNIISEYTIWNTQILRMYVRTIKITVLNNDSSNVLYTNRKKKLIRNHVIVDEFRVYSTICGHTTLLNTLGPSNKRFFR